MNEDKEILDLQPLDQQTKQIAQQILDEQNVDKVKDLTTFAKKYCI